ncbi:hypothetical protein HOLleu_40315 [Holothuria leucospilota]|uniref:Reverse transcriptase domain-containing protein n=1 Tax=Holothuria leucospilota TaxID=206669 RepID=A0A9Q0YF22_HOLLE|nr:hypothetical protein HOLleu_40315 [Holothuria leucospilota]
MCCWHGQHFDVFKLFVDLEKTFDTVCKERLWKILSNAGCPGHFIPITQQFHEGNTLKDLDVGVYIRFRTNGNLSNLRRVVANSKVMEDLAREFLSCDCAYMATLSLTYRS